MTVEAVRLENFMAFGDTGWIELRPICLLFGRNSSGKSAVIRGLRLLKQSLDCRPEEGPLVFVKEGGVDFGSFLELVHRQDPTRPMAFHFRCQLLETLDLLVERVNRQRRLDGQKELPRMPSQTWAEFKLGFSWNEKATWFELTELRVNCPWMVTEGEDRRTLLGAQLPLEEDLIELLGEGWYFWSDVFRQERGQEPIERLWTGVSVELASGFLPNLVTSTTVPSTQEAIYGDLHIAREVLRELNGSVEEFLRGIRYLGPIRPSPQRVYLFDSQRQLEWKQRDWDTLLSFLRGDVDYQATEEIDEWLGRLELGEDIDSFKQIYAGGLAVVSQVKIREAPSQETTNLTDVGFGASQVLPVILQSLLAKREAFVIIEQPELHLHPRAQSELGDLFVDVSRRNRRKQIMDARRRGTLEPTEETPIPDVRFLIETHSEHILLRLRLRIAETSVGRFSSTDREYLAQQSLGVYFVGREPPSSSVEQVLISKLGEMSSPPGFEGFFSDDLRETANLARARLESEPTKGEADDSSH